VRAQSPTRSHGGGQSADALAGAGGVVAAGEVVDVVDDEDEGQMNWSSGPGLSLREWLADASRSGRGCSRHATGESLRSPAIKV
jgi:hypothetical protein